MLAKAFKSVHNAVFQNIGDIGAYGMMGPCLTALIMSIVRFLLIPLGVHNIFGLSVDTIFFPALIICLLVAIAVIIFITCVALVEAIITMLE